MRGLQRALDLLRTSQGPDGELLARGRIDRCGGAVARGFLHDGPRAMVLSNNKRTMKIGAQRVETYSTANVPRATRAAYWNSVYASRLAHVTFNPADPTDFEAELHVGAIGPLGLARVTTRCVDIERNRAHISRGGARLFSFLLLARGSGEFEHCGHSTALQAGDFTLCDNAAPHRLHS